MKSYTICYDNIRNIHTSLAMNIVGDTPSTNSTKHTKFDMIQPGSFIILRATAKTNFQGIWAIGIVKSKRPGSYIDNNTWNQPSQFIMDVEWISKATKLGNFLTHEEANRIVPTSKLNCSGANRFNTNKISSNDVMALSNALDEKVNSTTTVFQNGNVICTV